MPKKHHTDLTKLKSSSSHASSSRDSPSSSSVTPSRTVSERLEQLRREQNPRPSIEARNEIATLVSQKTVPPDLRRLLSIPETAPPPPKRGMFRVRDRPPPGPAAPASWLMSSKHAPRNHKGKSPQRSTRKRPEKFNRLSYMECGIGLPESLVHQVLKTMARHWENLMESEVYNLAALPPSLKSMLISFLILYGPDDISVNTLKVLFFTDAELPGATGTEGLKRLDLSTLTGPNLTIADLNRYFASPRTDAGLDVLSRLRLDDSQSATKTSSNRDSSKTFVSTQLSEKLAVGEPQKSLSSTAQGSITDDDLADDWETAADALSGMSLHTPFQKSRFLHLTHLSLADPSPTVSWKELLTFSSHLATLTHLSLANWPIPTLTPNSTTAYVVAKTGVIASGGRDYYSELDGHWHEAANILRRFSNNTYCLQHLDLEGCGAWLPALDFSPPVEQGAASGPSEWTADEIPRSSPDLDTEEGNSDRKRSPITTGIDWNGSWSQITYLNVAQGWIPQDTGVIASLPANRIAWELLGELRSQREKEAQSPTVSKISLSKRKENPPSLISVNVWFKKEKEARRLAASIRARRSEAGGVYCKVDHGWEVGVGSFREGAGAVGD
ncbi:hypothetical protein K402DRAFT_391608 [Aulographum hederae CBS 113979]|uniref:Tafazzin n=1 Tax=Aulographum hederae CBS 113979 TaxID=1176131 RepID=A0A6G1H6W6_9PEZI|nr:hypothetical protein K402DRAFT_391608 [Aulographum hederae CBS 113979]